MDDHVGLELEQTLKNADLKALKHAKKEEKETYGNSLEFILSCMGFSVGIGNVWRFPFKCYKNGGGAFLLPYLIMLVLTGIPMYYMELSLGQFTGQGPLTSWEFAPGFRGIGYGMCIVTFWCCIYYNMLMAWIIYYLVSSFTSTLPWEQCVNAWNTYKCNDLQRSCLDDGGVMDNYTCTFEYRDWSEDDVTALNLTKGKFMNPAEEFWRYKVLQEDGADWDNPGQIIWPLAAALLVAWCLVFLCLCKGVTSSGKVVYITVTVPFVMLIVFFIRGVTLDGHMDGIKFFITPKWEKLIEAQTWTDAVSQIFYSNGIAFGALQAMSSHNKFKHNVKGSAVLLSCINSCTSVFAGFIIFSIIGFMAKEMNVEIDDVVKEGTGLAFIAYPTAATLMPVSTLWAILFFLMLFFLGLDSTFATIEALITGFQDVYPILRRYKTSFVASVCLVSFLFGLTMTTKGGIYAFTLFDWYSAGLSILILGFTETIVLMWVYGWHRWSKDLESMMGSKPNIVWRICWQFLSPFCVASIVVYSFVVYTPAYYGDYVFPASGQFLGWCLLLNAVLCIPAFFGIEFYRANGDFRQRLRKITSPSEKWGPRLPEDREYWKAVISGELEATPAEALFANPCKKRKTDDELQRNSQFTDIYSIETRERAEGGQPSSKPGFEFKSVLPDYDVTASPSRL